MNSYLIYLPIVFMIVLLGAGIPVAYSMAIAGTIGLVWILGFQQSLGVLQSAPHTTVANFLLSAVPMFILMAEYLSESGLTEDIFAAANAWLGHIPGGLAMSTTLANGFMAALSGSSTAAAASMASISVPEMREYDYDERLSMGTVSASGTFAAMIPPSLALIIYGIYTETSIANLFIAGIIPGFLTVIGYFTIIFLWSSYNPEIVGGEIPTKAPLNERIFKLRPIWPALIIILLVLVGLYGGFVTATEAGALGALGTFIVGISVADLGSSGIVKATRRAANISGTIIIIVVGAKIFSYYLTVTQITQTIVSSIAGLAVPAVTTLILLLIIYIALGAIMDQIAILILTLPLTFPIILNLGYDPIWFGIILTKTVEIGLVTPPFGLNVYVSSGTVDADIMDSFAGAARFLIVDILILILLIIFPGIATFIVPN